jgi:hypothetical protein
VNNIAGKMSLKSMAKSSSAQLESAHLFYNQLKFAKAKLSMEDYIQVTSMTDMTVDDELVQGHENRCRQLVLVSEVEVGEELDGDDAAERELGHCGGCIVENTEPSRKH